MRNFVWLIFIFVFFGSIVGCDEPVKKRPVFSPNGIKITDLFPEKSEKQPTAINFKILTFRIPVTNYGGMSGAFNGLSRDLMRFSNQKSFKANGFAAGLGNSETWQSVGNCLRKVGAKRKKISTLIIYEDIGEDQYPGNEFMIGNISSNTLVSYYDLSGNSRKMNLTPGLLQWRFKARKIAHRRGLVQVKIEGLFKRWRDTKLSRLEGYDTGEIVFKPTSMVMNMNVGDFVLIGALPRAIFSEPIDDENRFVVSPDGDSIEQMRLVELFFRTRGDVIMPKVTEGKGKEVQAEKGITGEVSYHRVKDVDIVEVFLIVCMGVEN
ncbi:MAG: hypothetical protein FVQ82_11835 [Planctomycetes bacterium]|nr:hypothetical protein [Planctomycetota bacterium]